MKHLYLSKQILIIILFVSVKQIGLQFLKLKYPQEKYFKISKQITFRENIERYWSFDDSKLIFQSTNEKWGENVIKFI